MALREVVTIGDPVLRRKAQKVTVFADDRLQILIDDMVDTMMDAPGVGLAAPQVAVRQRVIVVRLPDDEMSREEYGDDAGVLHAVVNPEIARQSKEMTDGTEACLSIPGYFGTVSRHVTATIKGQDRHGKKIRIKATNWLARVFQHEIDHLNGVLFIDLASEIWQSPSPEEVADDMLIPKVPEVERS